MRIKLSLSTSIVCSLLILAAARAELLNIPDEPANWNGPYLGFNVGGLFDHFDIHGHDTLVDLTEQFYEATDQKGAEGHTLAVFSVPGHSPTNGSVVGSVDLGYNMQWGHFVAGVSAGFSETHSDVRSKFHVFEDNSVSDDSGANIQSQGAETDFKAFEAAQQNWSAYAGGQVGFAWNRWLFYATGGAAFTDVDFSSLDDAHTFFASDGDIIPHEPPPESDANNRSSSHDDCILVGWYVGGGTLFAFTDTVSAGIEYRRSDFGSDSFSSKPDAAVFPNHIDVDLKSDEVVFKVNINLGTLFGFRH